jgi:hypothetical protein
MGLHKAKPEAIAHVARSAACDWREYCDLPHVNSRDR